MNLLRNALIGGIVLVSFLLVIRWNEFQERKFELAQDKNSAAVQTPAPSVTPPTETATTSNDINTESEVPTIDPNAAEPNTADEHIAQPGAQLINVTTDTLQVVIDTQGGDIVRVALPQYYAKLNEADNPFVLLNKADSHTYIAKSGLALPKGQKKLKPVFSAETNRYTMQQNMDSLQIDLHVAEENLDVIKRFTFTRGSYLVDVEYIITNKGSTNWVGALYGQILRDGSNPNNSTSMGMKPFLGAAITTPETNYKKYKFKDLDEGTINVDNQGGWVALVQHYFLSAWVPDQTTDNTYYLGKFNKDLYMLRFISAAKSAAPGETLNLKAQFYAGPKDIKALETIAPHLDLTIDFSWLWMIAKPLHVALLYIHDFVGNWGVAIIILTFFIKLIFFYPSAMSYRSMAKMRKVQPLMQELKDRYGDDRQKMSAELMRLYKKEKVNPLGGCLPILMQMPVFIALYWMIMESVELRHAPFFFWIQDLSVKDPFFVLPLLMGATMFIQQKLNPTPPDPMQAKIMQMMPIFFTALFMMFPAGLVLYWVVNNTLSITQQYIITKQIENADK
ncbi:YidC/Oxa1 family membrane protein insertase [Alteromonadaceae bacterium 2753L.S.0a.02]|nr:YidC/Oxa1 family membrane protein insertase [Alteromonadaceae bacterium 2753L.S.0a.02]